MIQRLSIGDLDIVIASDGQPDGAFEPRLEEFFPPESGVTQGELRDAAEHEGAGRKSVRLGYNCLLFDSGAGWTMIDSGLGSNFLGYGAEIEPFLGRLGRRLLDAGVSPSSVEAVLFTHLHQDHARGAIWAGGPTFPDASAFVHVAEVEYWSDAPTASTARAHVQSATATIRILKDRLRSFDYGTEVSAHVRAIDASGHTPGHTAFELNSRGSRLLCVGDSLYDPLQVHHPTWRTPWDLEAARSVQSRRRLLELAAEQRLLVHAYHLPFPGLGFVERFGIGFRWTPVLEP